jgi:hypothetical protein
LVLVSAAVGFGLRSVLGRAPGLALCLLLGNCTSCTSTEAFCWGEEQVMPWDGSLALEELAFLLVSWHPATQIYSFQKLVC